MRASLQPKRIGFLQPEEKALRKPHSRFPSFQAFWYLKDANERAGEGFKQPELSERGSLDLNCF